MLLFHGFDESNDQLKCPLNLKISLRTCIKSHARLLPNLKNRGLFPNDVLSEPISWGSSCQLQKKLHGVSIRENIDFGCNMFTLQLTQGLYQQMAIWLLSMLPEERQTRKGYIHMENALHATVAKLTIVFQLRSRAIFFPDNPMIPACIFT